MGYRFSLKNANAVGHLVEGSILSFIEDTLTSPEYCYPNLEFISDFIENPERNFLTSWEYSRYIRRDMDSLRRAWAEKGHIIKNYFNSLVGRKEQLRPKDFYKGNEVRSFADILYGIHRILSSCRIKSILLPGFDDNEIDRLLIDNDLLRSLVKIHPGNSCLILQLKEIPDRDKIYLFNSFRKFSKAFKRVEQWPGVLLWNNHETVFIRIEQGCELEEIFYLIAYEANLGFIRERVKRGRDSKRFAYILHLSDLHFGNEIADRRQGRVISLIENQLSDMEEDAYVYPLITGDILDTPSQNNKASFDFFSDSLTSKGTKAPIFVLGNHDVETKGILKKQTSQKAIISSLQSNKVEIIKELGLGILKFNSNVGGKFAQGKIGKEQLLDFANELDKLDAMNLTLIAMLHHHPKTIENPTWYAQKWYEKILGAVGLESIFESMMELVDAKFFLDWVRERNIEYILHGHKHIPVIHKHEGINIIAAGSSTGMVDHVEKHKTYLSYNIIKYDIELRKPVSCSIYFEEILGGGIQHLQLQPL